MAKLNIITLGSSKNYTDLAVLGLTNVVVNDQDKTISFTLVADGSQHTIHFDQPSDGKDGSDGVGISKIEKIGTVDLVDTYRITFTDNSTFDYEVKNGKDGTGGEGASTWSEISDKPFESLSTDFSVENGELKVVGGTGGGEENKIDSISVNGTPISVDENKNVDITVPNIDGLAKTEDIPTKVSELTNDSGYLTEHQDISGKVDKVEGKSLISDTEIARLASVDNYDDTDIRTEIAKKADANAIPSKVSELTNDSNYQTAEQVNSTVTTEIAKVVADAPEDLNTLKEMSDWIAGHEDDASAMNSAISDNKTAITALQTGKADKSEIPTTVAELTDSGDYAKKTDLHSHTNKTVLDGITEEKVTAWDNKSDFSGSYNDLNDKPTIDAELSNTSENAIQNKVVTEEINKLYSDISFNDHDTATSGTSFTDAEDGNMLVTNATRNLLNPTLQTVTKDGITCTNNGDGTYTLNGRCNLESGRIAFLLLTDIRNTKYIKDIKYVGNTKDSYEERTAYLTVDIWKDNTWVTGSDVADEHGILVNDIIENAEFDSIQYTIHVDAGKTCNNVVIKPMLTTDLSATYDDFVPYSGYDIKTCGKNLLNPTLKTTTINGVTISNNGYGTYTLQGTSTSHIWSALRKVDFLADGVTYKLVGCPPGGSTYGDSGTYNIYIPKITGSGDMTDTGNGVKFNSTGYIGEYIMLWIAPNVTLNNIVIKPMITTDLNSTYDEYEPYKDGGTVHIDSTTEFPLLGLKSFDGETNIISPGNVEVTYAKSDSGKAILDMSENKLDKDNVVNNQTTAEEGFALDARQANPNLDGTLAKQVADLNGSLEKLNDFTDILSNDNLNDSKFFNVGKYCCSLNSTAETVLNSPFTTAFTMEAFQSTGKDNRYIAQKAIEFEYGHCKWRVKDTVEGIMLHDWAQLY